ncbi:DUF402 domain-containing protein [Mobilicoccus caccae]|uniref:DUF402 domain-containing protein n=1 Tax=Mobilicoccus caccae TaxID=1859295 RepID=A0ABQ6ITE0_9MICO|nr:DUF402 domain-containing protein [Mobilicoccus caccae]GMA40931.1 hypothetical protein GCM10025883_29760 [Mobilicoccus caccae]
MEAGTLSPAELPFGARVRAVFTKYDGRPHWEYDLVVLGVDEYGVWVGGAPGGHIARPGLEFTSDAYWVSLYPHEGMWVATINDTGGTFSSRVYVDVTTQASWWHRPDGVLQVSAADLDLDVIRRFTGEVFVDDEDEFEDHRRQMGYPADLVEGARNTATMLYDRLRSRGEPFEEVAESWVSFCRERVSSDEAGRAVVDREPDADVAVEDPPEDASWTFEAPEPAEQAAPPVAEHPAEVDDTGEEDLLAVWADENRDRPLVPEVEADDGPAVEIEREDDDLPVEDDVEWNSAPYASGEADYPHSGPSVARDFADVEGIDTSPVDPSEITGLLVTTETGRESPLWFDGRSVDPEEVDITGELADHLRDWTDRWNRDFDPVRGWHPRAVIGDYEALGRWLGRRVKDEVGGLTVTLQLAHLGRSSLTEIPAADERDPEIVELDPRVDGDLPVRGDIVTLAGTVGCFSSEVNTRLSAWAESGGGDEVEAEELRWFMGSELGPDYRVL